MCHLPGFYVDDTYVGQLQIVINIGPSQGKLYHALTGTLASPCLGGLIDGNTTTQQGLSKLQGLMDCIWCLGPGVIIWHGISEACAPAFDARRFFFPPSSGNEVRRGDGRELCTLEQARVLREVCQDGGGGRRAAPVLRKFQQRGGQAALRREGGEAPPAMVQGV